MANDNTPKISTPGLYDLPADAYHAGPCDGPSIGSSGLRTILNECPAKYWYESELNPQRPKVEKKEFDFGRAAHTWLLEGDKFLATIHVMTPGLNMNTKEAKAEKAEAAGAGLTIVSADDFENIKGMRDALASHEWAGAAFKAGRVEPSLIWRDAETGVWLRCRPDFLPNALAYIPDYKTAASARPARFIRAAYDFGYHMQAAHEMDGIEAVMGERPKSFFFVVQEKKAPWLISVVALDAEAIAWGRIQNRAAVDLYARCLKENRWPGYAEEVVEMPLPAYALAELQRRSNSGAFALKPTQQAA